jgi:hypothetical protein
MLEPVVAPVFEYPVEHAIELALRASPSPRAVHAELLRHIVRQLPFPKSAEVVTAFVGK